MFRQPGHWSMVSGNRLWPSKAFTAHRGGKLVYAARKQRALFFAQRPSLSTLKTKHPNRFHYLEKVYGGRNGSSSNYFRTRRGRKWDHYDGREGRGERGRSKERKSQRRDQRRRSSRSMSPIARDRYDAVERDVAYFDYDNSRGEGSEFRNNQAAELCYNVRGAGEFKDDDQGSEWEDELQVLDELDGYHGPHRAGRIKAVEIEYLKRMLTRLRNRHKELFPHRNRGDLPRGKLCDNRNGDNYGRKPYATPPSPNQSHRRTRSGDSSIRRGGSSRRYRRSLERTPAHNNDHYGNGKSQRRYSVSHVESKTSQLAPISNQLKAAVGIRTYPTRTFGMALHVKRWLSDRYTKQASFNFGELPRSEGVKKHYILDPNNPNRYMNVPRPSQPTPGARGDYYRGAAWGAYQQEKREWLATQGCNYPDTWVSANTVDGDKGGYKDGAKDTFMVSSETGDTTSVDASMSDAESDTTVRGPHGPSRNSFNNRQATPGDEMDTASEVSEDLISLDADDDNGVLLPALLDQRITDISSMIRQTTIIDNRASAIPAIATASMSALSELMTLSEQPTQVLAVVGQPAAFLSPTATAPAKDTNVQETFQVANPSTAASHSHLSIALSPAAIGNMEQIASPPAIAPTVLSQAITSTHVIASTSAPVVGPAPLSTTVPGRLSTNFIIPDEDWNKEWEEEWLYHF
ncbi:hypothetical protein L211DRAFT_881552 [Terfezia boudieri ATCC MYA-4762]|uniref:Uncharacterized protein n=1 Tax=Terfezia boudieri ATCC MYA-4762 TaxID=1051890 RepID=A0A3N4M5A1_9PEZI|nr:hypothetical protein L211DRAFT_881552 [Terfezia boudieri ATCC MYA-4762]